MLTPTLLGWLLVATVTADASIEAAPGEEAETAAAVSDPPDLFLDVSLNMATNPLVGGLHAGARLRRYQGHGRQPELLFRDTYLEGELAVRGSPSVVIGRVAVEWLPIQLLQLRLQYEIWGFTGNPNDTGTGLPLEAPDVNIGDAALEAREPDIVAGAAHRLSLQPIFRAKLWRIVLVDRVQLDGLYVHGPQEFFYWDDGIVARGRVDLTIKNRAFLLFDVVQGPGVHRLWIGGMHEIYRVTRTSFRRQRVAGVVIYSPVCHWRRLYEPSLTLLFGGHVEHPQRRGFYFGFSLDFHLTPRHPGAPHIAPTDTGLGSVGG